VSLTTLPNIKTKEGGPTYGGLIKDTKQERLIHHHEKTLSNWEKRNKYTQVRLGLKHDGLTLVQ
jgi:hypothetical protein